MARVKLPRAIIKKILLRLPVKSLLSFKSLSKEWFWLISTSEFANAHLKISIKNNGYINDKLIFGSKTIPPDLNACSLQSIIEAFPIDVLTDANVRLDRVRFDCPSVEQGSNFRFVDSCNGLVCVLVKPNTIILWNPTTGKSALHSSLNMGSGSRLMSWGFGYDELHNDYKVVQLFSDTHVEFYSLRADSWKPLSNRTCGFINTYDDLGKFIHGAIHWLGYIAFDRLAILSHDLATDTSALLPTPILDTDYFRFMLDTFRGWLAVYCIHNRYMNVWAMKEYGWKESWTKVLHIPFSVGDVRRSFCMPSLVCLLENGRIILNYGSRIRIHDLSNSQPHQFYTISELHAITYMQSLVSPNPDYVMDFPQDMIFEILLRLPVKSLLRFQSVSNEWHSLISSSFFVKAHLKISTENPLISTCDRLIFGSRLIPTVLHSCSLQSLIGDSSIHVLTDENVELDHVPFECPSVESGSYFWFVDTCNGLVGVRVHCDHFIFWNPSTRESRMLWEPDLFVGYACVVMGFGYDKLHDDYKLMELLSDDDDKSEHVRVYSLKTDSWKIFPNIPDGDSRTYGEFGRFIHGAIHWTGYSTKRKECIVYSFDLATETFAELPMPKIEAAGCQHYEIAVLGGCLAVTINYYLYVEVWLMKQYGRSESWTKVVDIPLYLDLSSPPNVVFLLGNDKILLDYGASLRIYDFSNPQLHHFDTTSQFDAIAYVESLVSPYHGSDLDES